MEEGDDNGFLFMAGQMQMNISVASSLMADGSMKIDHRTLPRSARTKYDHEGALRCIQRDYIGPQPLFDGREFETMFRISKRRFEAICQDIGSSGDPFFLTTHDAQGRPAASLHARLSLPLKTLAYGVPTHTFRDYFSMSKGLARDCCFEFDRIMKELYEEEYLRLPTPEDLKNIELLHKKIHRVPGMCGSLDCMHTHWKNCPKAWQGQCQGKENEPTMILEAISDCNLWMWHVACGCAGTLNDLNVLNLSPFLDSLVSGRFADLENESGVVPFQILEGDQFHQMFVTVDGMYPQYSRFVKGFTQPVTQVERNYTGWQESVRKDIERAFGVLQLKFQWTSRPTMLHQLKDIAARVRTCMLLHNMCVADRVMEGDVRKRCDPSHNITEVEECIVPMPEDLAEVQEATGCGSTASSIGVRNMPEYVHRKSTRREAWNELNDTDNHCRLHNSLKHYVDGLPMK